VQKKQHSPASFALIYIIRQTAFLRLDEKFSGELFFRKIFTGEEKYVRKN